MGSSRNLLIVILLGSVLLSSFSLAYAQTSSSFQLTENSITAGGANSTSPGSSGFKLLSTIGVIAGFIQSTGSSGFQLIAGLLPTFQGGNTVPAGLFLGLSPTIGSDGSFQIPLSPTSTGTISFSADTGITTTATTASVTISRDYSFTDSGGFGATTLFESGTQITADTASWDGTFLAPQISPVSPTPGGSNVERVIRIGSGSIDFTLSQPVRIIFTGHAGANVGVLDKSGSTIDITTQCNGVDFATVAAQLGTREACKINSNADLIVWTKRASDYFVYTDIQTSGGIFRDIQGPSFTQNFKEDENSLVIGDTLFPKIAVYNKKIQTATLKTGTQIPFRLLMSENGGPQNVQHVALYMNLRGDIVELHKSDTLIIFEKGQEFAVRDPNGFIADAYAATSTKGDKFEITFYVTFAKPMQTSALAIVAWDKDRNAAQSTILDAFEVISPQKEVERKAVESASQEIKEKEAVLDEALQVVKEKEAALAFAITKYGTASTEAKVAQEAVDKAKEEAKAAEEAVDEAKSKLTEETKDTITQTQPKVKEPALPTPEPGVVVEPGIDTMTSEQKETIQKWGGFHTVAASDSDLLKSLNIKTADDKGQKLPKWTKNNLAKWVLDDKITMKEFVNAIKYIVKK